MDFEKLKGFAKSATEKTMTLLRLLSVTQWSQR